MELYIHSLMCLRHVHKNTFTFFTLIFIVVCGLLNLLHLPYEVSVATDLPIRHFCLFGVASWSFQNFRYLVFRVASHPDCRETAVEGRA